MRWLKLILSMGTALSVVLFFNTKIGFMPPVGKILDPFHGFWQNAEIGEKPENQVLQIDGLKEPVNIHFDDRQIPHIFAENDHDLYFAQGFVTAKDRLWQMEFQTHAAAGRLSEIIGSRTLEYDRFQRRVGMVVGAKNALQEMENRPLLREIVHAYTAGVNAYIKSLQPKDFPIEYKILDYAPEPWTPLKCALLLKYMAWMLTGYASDLQMSNTLTKFSAEDVYDLFPHYPKDMDPVIPTDTPWNFSPFKINQPQTAFKPKIIREPKAPETNPGNGSNNWAVSGSKTASGLPILANDPHLEMNLPSIWYELQLVSPSVNVYGVSVPGAPNVIIGFNDQIAWGVTNAEADVMDWYEITFKDSSLNEYWHDKKWKPTKRLVEEIKVRSGNTVLDTLVFTHHGPVSYNSNEKSFSRRAPTMHALRWLGHDPSNEAFAFYQLNRAQNYDDYVAALSNYACPAQNFVFADANGDIAIWHNGKFPAKWRGQGQFISDGADPLYDWQGWIPHEQNPHIKNPEREFVSSANQNATDLTYPYYLNWYYAAHYRVRRINERLTQMKNIVPDDFRNLQLDTKNLHAESVLPTLLGMIKENDLTPEESGMFEELTSWNFFNDADKIAPAVFDRWWKKLYRVIWDDEFSDVGAYLRYPSKYQTARKILEEPDSKWFDDIRTEKIENLQELILSSFSETCTELEKSFGKMSESWHWGKVKSTDITHLARISGFGRMDLNAGGDLGIVNAIGRTHGPSWRMVVALGPEVQAWGIYPGGQSGNPGSLNYDDFIDSWMKGELAELLFLKSEDQQNIRILSKLTLR